MEERRIKWYNKNWKLWISVILRNVVYAHSDILVMVYLAKIL